MGNMFEAPSVLLGLNHVGGAPHLSRICLSERDIKFIGRIGFQKRDRKGGRTGAIFPVLAKMDFCCQGAMESMNKLAV
jgi:hypothetical protein